MRMKYFSNIFKFMMNIFKESDLDKYFKPYRFCTSTYEDHFMITKKLTINSSNAKWTWKNFKDSFLQKLTDENT